MTLDHVKDEDGDGATNIDDVQLFLKRNKAARVPLNGGGDFRSAECVEFLKEADIVVTNPPFSLFREYVAQLVEHGKKFLIIGNQNAITYKEIFPLIKADKLWMGATIHSGDREFRVQTITHSRRPVGALMKTVLSISASKVFDGLQT